MNDHDSALTGRIALVTGGSRGIGFAAAQRLLRRGARVAIAARNATDVADAVRALSDDGDITGFTMDVSRPSDVDAVIDAVRTDHGPIDILVANAGGGGPNVAVDEIPLDDWQAGLDLNVTSVFTCIAKILPDMRSNGWGRIVTISSRAAFAGGVLRDSGPRASAYAAAKAAAASFTRVIALEHAADGITANVVAPGPIATAAFVARRTDQELADMAVKIPVGRLGTPDDVAHAIEFIVTDPGFLTGQVIHVNGGTWVG